MVFWLFLKKISEKLLSFERVPRREAKCYLKLSKKARRARTNQEKERSLNVLVRERRLGSLCRWMGAKIFSHPVEHIYMASSFIVRVREGFMDWPAPARLWNGTLYYDHCCVYGRNDFVNWTWSMTQRANWKRVLNTNGWQVVPFSFLFLFLLLLTLWVVVVFVFYLSFYLSVFILYARKKQKS